MNRRKKQIGVVLGLVAIVCFVAAWPIYKWLTIKAANPHLFERTKTLVEKNPQLKPDWDRAMQDNVLTESEAKEIVEKAGEKLEPEK